jgi:hypothetical protein
LILPGLPNALIRSVSKVLGESEGEGQLSEFRAKIAKVTHSTGDVEPDDFVSPMTIETYIEYRLKPVVALSKKRTPKLASKLSRFETLTMALNAVATLLTALDQKTWVVLVVILITVVSNMLQYQLVQQRLASHNGVVRDVDGLQTYLAGLSIIQLRTRRVKAMCVDLVEDAIMETVQAWTGLSALLFRTDAGEGEDNKDKKKGE